MVSLALALCTTKRLAIKLTLNRRASYSWFSNPQAVCFCQLSMFPRQSARMHDTFERVGAELIKCRIMRACSSVPLSHHNSIDNCGKFRMSMHSQMLK
jgi:hypothetical protein